MRDGVDIVIPTLGRPQALGPLAENICSTTPPGDYSIFFVIDHTDDDSTEAATAASPEAQIIHADGTYPRKTNVGFRAGWRTWVLPIADDVWFHEHWYEAAMAVRSGYAVIGTNDTSPMSNSRHATMPLIRRTYAEHPGASWGERYTIFHEGYHHNYVETEVCELAQARGLWTYEHDAVIEHRHPSWGTREIDDTDRKGQLTGFDSDSHLFSARREFWRRRLAA